MRVQLPLGPEKQTTLFSTQTSQREQLGKMVRTPCRDENGMKKGTWTPEEDRKLIAYVTRYGCWNWRQLPRFAGERDMNY